MIKVGIIGEVKDKVSENNIAKALRSGALNVYATPAMVALMEEAAYKSRRLVFKVEAFDERGKIGEGIHERFIISNEDFQNKTNNK